MGNWVFLKVFKLVGGEKLIWVYVWALSDSLSLGFVNEEYFEWTGGWIMFVKRVYWCWKVDFVWIGVYERSW